MPCLCSCSRLGEAFDDGGVKSSGTGAGRIDGDTSVVESFRAAGPECREAKELWELWSSEVCVARAVGEGATADVVGIKIPASCRLGEPTIWTSVMHPGW